MVHVGEGFSRRFFSSAPRYPASKAQGSRTADLQRDALIEAGVDPEQLYEDQASGKRDDRPGPDACLRALRARGTLIVWKLDRLGRNLSHLVDTVQTLNARGVGFNVLTGQGASIDATTANGRLMFAFSRRSRSSSAS